MNLHHISFSMKILLLSKKHLKCFYTAVFFMFYLCFSFPLIISASCCFHDHIYAKDPNEYTFFLKYIDTLNYWCSQCTGSLLGRNHKISFIVRNNVRCIYPVGTSFFSHICFPGHGFPFILLASSVLYPHRHLLHSAYCVLIMLCHAWDISKTTCFYYLEQRV